jgi:hypothetical protein
MAIHSLILPEISSTPNSFVPPIFATSHLFLASERSSLWELETDSVKDVTATCIVEGDPAAGSVEGAAAAGGVEVVAAASSVENVALFNSKERL